MGEPEPTPTALWGTGENGPRAGAGLYREDDRTQPGAGHAADHAAFERGGGEAESLSAAALSDPGQKSRCRTRGRCGPNPPNPERAGDAEDVARRILQPREDRQPGFVR